MRRGQFLEFRGVGCYFTLHMSSQLASLGISGNVYPLCRCGGDVIALNPSGSKYLVNRE